MKTFKHFRKLEGIAATRIRLGISQEAFAMELGISRSMLSRAENRQRTLPTATLIKLAALETALVANPEKSKSLHFPVEKNSVDHYSTTTLHFTRTNCRLHAANLHARLLQMITRYNQVSRSLVHIELLIAAAENGKGHFAPAYLQVHRYTLCRKLNKCGPAAQAALRYRIALLEAAGIMEAKPVEDRALEGGAVKHRWWKDESGSWKPGHRDE